MSFVQMRGDAVGNENNESETGVVNAFPFSAKLRSWIFLVYKTGGEASVSIIHSHPPLLGRTSLPKALFASFWARVSEFYTFIVSDTVGIPSC